MITKYELTNTHGYSAFCYRLYGLAMLIVLITAMNPVFGQQPAQVNKEINGKVIDIKGYPMPGVSIVNKSTQSRTQTNTNGEFRIEASQGAVLLFSFVGFISEIKTVGSEKTMNLTLVETHTKLDEITVIGYGTVKNSDVTGAASSVKFKKTEEQSFSSFDQMLVGKMAGVAVSQNSGEPGSGVMIEVRGTNSISASSRPLYVIDGVPIEEPDNSKLSNIYVTGNLTNPLAAINPNDIERIDVLKDASATAIYGSRGANGVVIVTTKSGSSGKTNIAFNYSTSISSNVDVIKVLNSQQYADLANEAITFKKLTPIPFTSDELQNLPYYDHVKEITQTGIIHDGGISISTGDSKQKLYLSGQYFFQEGTIINSSLKRLNSNIKYERNLTDKFKLSTNLNLSKLNSSGSITGSSVILNALSWAPTSPFINPDGSYNYIPDYGYGKDRFAAANADLNNFVNNPLAYVKEYQNDNSSYQILGNILGTYNITDKLTANVRLGTNIYNSLLEAYRPSFLPYDPTNLTKGFASVGSSYSSKTLYEGTVNYNNTIGKNHSLTALLGVTSEDYNIKTYTSGASNFSQDITGVNFLEGGTTPTPAVSTYSEYSLLSFLGRFNYSFKHKYLLTASGRYDGSSKFGENHKFGFFPAVALAWKIEQEKFMQENFKSISNLKLRVSYGVTGNQSVPPYQSLSQLVTGNSSATGTFIYANPIFGGVVQTGYVPVKIANPDLTWETTKQFNVGLDVGLFKERVSLTMDVYNKQTSNLLLNAPIPSTSGFTSVFQNVGSVENKGVELSLNTLNMTGAFEWSTNFNIGFNKNKVLKLTGGNGSFLLLDNVVKIEEGRPFGQFYGYVDDGIWNDATISSKAPTFMPAAVAGNRKYKDLNGDHLLNDDDKTYIGNSLPQYTGGLTNNFRYKQFEMEVFFNFSQGSDKMNRVRVSLENYSGKRNASLAALGRWTPTNLDSAYPRAGNSSATADIRSGLIEDASFIRCKSVTFSYALPRSLTDKLKLGSAKLFISGQNLFIITKYSGFSAESNYTSNNGLVRGVEQYAYPDSRTFKAGINVNL